MRWLEREARGKWVFFYIFIFLAAKFVYAFAAFLLLQYFGVDIPPPSRGKVDIVWYTPFSLFISVLFEELAFRLFPLVIAIQSEWPTWGILLVAAVMSAIFGLLHGGIPYVFVQGVFGFAYSILFLKCGGLEKKYIKALSVTVAIHFLWNAILVSVAYANGAVSF